MRSSSSTTLPSTSSALLRHGIVLGLLTAVGPFAIDMYLPALPAIGRSLGADAHAVQASLMAFFIALGAGQLVSGPLSDMFGRKRPLYIGLAIFLAASVGCATAPTVGTLIAFRLLQGLGACAVMVIPRAVVRDLYAGAQAARLMSLLMTVYSVSPILAPLAGSVATETLGWRSVFWLLAALAALGAVLVTACVRETRPPSARLQSSLRGALAGYRVLLGDRRFLGLALIASLTLAGFFVYVANSSFVMSAHYGASPHVYALLFALNAVSFVAASQMNGWLATRFGLRRAVRMASAGHAATMALLLILTLAGVDRLGVLVTLLFVGYGLNGIIVPSTFVLAMEGHAALAGTASALIGTLNFAGGAVVVAVVSPFANGTPLPMVWGIAACSFAVLALAQRTLRPVAETVY
jgi:DHA1 family bicyclomycin/chloramphenicol resistance-like MFS transporter